MAVKPPDDTFQAVEASIAPDEGHPAQIGPYRILRVLGRGGMGVVYEAEPLALRALAIRDSLADTTNVKESLTQVVTLYDRWGKPDRAAEFQRRL